MVFSNHFYVEIIQFLKSTKHNLVSRIKFVHVSILLSGFFVGLCEDFDVRGDKDEIYLTNLTLKNVIPVRNCDLEDR